MNMYERILVPLDGSESAENVLPWVEDIARKLEAEILLLRVLTESDDGVLDNYFQTVLTSAERYLEEISDWLTGNGLRSSYEALAGGNISEEILDYAASRNAGLIVMATHGRSGLKRLLKGSVAEGVVREADRAVILIRSGGDCPESPLEKGVNKILVPLDGSPQSGTIIPWVAELAGEIGAEVVLLQVIRPTYSAATLDAGAGIVELPFPTEEMESIIVRATKELRETGRPLEERGIFTVPLVVTGEASREICRITKEVNAGLIAMATHGRAGIDRWLLGSVADKVLHAADVPLMLVRTTATVPEPAPGTVSEAKAFTG